MFGSRLKFLRKTNKITQQKIAEALQIARSTYAQYESGRFEPDIHVIRKIALFYNISIDFLLNVDMQTVDPQLDEMRSQLWDYIAKTDRDTALAILNLFKALDKR